MSQAPVMPIWTDALIGDTTHLSAEEFGVYMLLLIATWRNNGAPFADDDDRLARICRVSKARWVHKIRPALAGFFDLSGGTWRQKRLEKEWDFIAKKRGKNAEAGRASAKAKRLKINESAATNVAATLQPNGQRNGNPHIHIHSEDPIGPSGADAPSADPPIDGPPTDPPPPPPVDPVKELWDRGVAVLGASSRSLIGKARRQYGDLAVAQAIAACEAECPSHPAEFFLGCLRRAPPQRAGTYRQSPVTSLFEGAHRAAEAFIARHQADSIIDFPADGALLDSRRSGGDAAGAARRLARRPG